MKYDLNKIADFLFETGMLAKTPRSGFFFLGTGKQSVAEHTNRVGYIGFALASMVEEANEAKVLEMCLFHDISETRTSDPNYVHQKYLDKKEDKAVDDLVQSFPFGGRVKDILDEYKERKTIESKIVKDADNLELLLSLKEQADIGNEKALTWMKSVIERLILDESKQLAEVIMNTDSDQWWFEDKDGEWWINRKR